MLSSRQEFPVPSWYMGQAMRADLQAWHLRVPLAWITGLLGVTVFLMLLLQVPWP